jgi:hypothetical protein
MSMWPKPLIEGILLYHRLPITYRLEAKQSNTLEGTRKDYRKLILEDTAW